MTFAEKCKAKIIIKSIARKEGSNEKDIRQAMQEALDAAWTEVRDSGNIHGQNRWQRLFGTRKPSVEEFITKCAEQVKREENNASSSLDVNCV